MPQNPSDAKSDVGPGMHAGDFPQEETGLLDLVRFLYQSRLTLAVHFVVLLGIGLIAFTIWYARLPRTAETTLGLTFRGIERGEYPSGEKFNLEDFRSPEILSLAMADAAVSTERVTLPQLAAHTYVTPVIPQQILNIWRKQDRDGTRKDEYFPEEFKIGIEARAVPDDQRLRLLDAVVNRYRERIKFDQEAALSFAPLWEASYEKIAADYDFWDIPELYGQDHQSLRAKLSSAIATSSQYRNPKYQLSFRSIERELEAWRRTRLQVLEATTYQGRLVKNRDQVMLRIQHRIDDLAIQIRGKSREADEVIRILEIVERPRGVLAGQLSKQEGIPTIDATALDRLLQNDYVGPVVERITGLKEEIQRMETEKARLEKQQSLIPRAQDINLKQLPPGYSALIDTLSAELKTIAQEYNRVLDDYLTVTTTSLVIIKHSPRITRAGPSGALVLIGIVLLCLFLTPMLVGVEHLFKKARED